MAYRQRLVWPSPGSRGIGHGKCRPTPSIDNPPSSRIPRTLPKVLEATAIQKLIDTAASYRDKAILMLLCRTGQRIGDWSAVAGRHGILGMALEDIDRKRRFITVRLKGARDQHRVPVTDDFWPIYDEYLHTERHAAPDVHAVWIASRKGQGKPLRYASFESALRYIGRRAGISVHPHLFRVTRSRKPCWKPPATSRSRRKFSGIHT